MKSRANLSSSLDMFLTNVTGPLGALEINNLPGVNCKESLKLLFQLIDCLEHLLHSFYNSCHSSVTFG